MHFVGLRMRPIAVSNLKIGYKNHVVAENINFVLEQNDFVIVIGPNGGGKTTLVKTILGIIPPLDGSVEVLGCSVHHVCPHRKRIGYVPQMGKVKGDLPATLLDVVLSGLFPYMHRISFIGKEERKLALRMIEELGLFDKRNELFANLSGGQQKRGLVARALMGHPDALIFDEPTSGVDIAAASEFRKLIVDLHKNKGIPILLVTHDINPYLDYLTKIIIIGRGMCRVGGVELLKDEEFLKKIYGESIKILEINGKIYLLSGDFHNA